MSAKTKQEINREYFQKKKNEEHMCPECKIPVKFQSRQAHLKTKKHIENCKKEYAEFFVEFNALNKKLLEPTPNITDIMRKLYYLIQDEFFNEDGTEILTDVERWAAPEPKNPEETEFCDNTGFAMRTILKEMFDKKIRDLDSHKAVDEWERYETQFEKKNYEERDAKVFYLTVFRNLKAPAKEAIPVEGEKEQEQAQDTAQSDTEDEEEQDDVLSANEDEEEDDDNGNDTYKIDETNYITCHFPPLYEFRDLKKSKQEIVLEEIAVNCAHVFDDDKRVVIERIYEALSERDKLQYQILYDDIFSFYQRYKAQLDSYRQSESSSDIQSTNGDQEEEMFEYDFKY